MKYLITFIFSLFILSSLQAQPCKQVKIGMSSDEVLKLVGKPSEIDSLGSALNDDGTKNFLVVWQYGNVGKNDNQRVSFDGDKVADVIADGKKYEELLMALKRGEIQGNELPERIEKLNREACK